MSLLFTAIYFGKNPIFTYTPHKGNFIKISQSIAKDVPPYKK